MGSTPKPVMDQEVLRRARESLRVQLVSLEARLEHASEDAIECARGWDVATLIAEAQEKLDEAMGKLDELLGRPS